MADNKEQKFKALQTTLEKLDKAYGKGTVMRLSDKKVMDVEVISTGSVGLDLALGIGGIPRGRVRDIYGTESSGKPTREIQGIEEEKKAEAMHATNQIISDGFVGHLLKIPSMQSEISDIRSKLKGKTMAQSIIAKLNDELDKTEEANKLYDKALEIGASDEAAAEALIEPSYSAINYRLNNWKSLYSEYKRDNESKKKK